MCADQPSPTFATPVDPHRPIHRLPVGTEAIGFESGTPVPLAALSFPA